MGRWRLAGRRGRLGQGRIEDDAPHIILLPERPFDQDRFLADVKRCYDRYGLVLDRLRRRRLLRRRHADQRVAGQRQVRQRRVRRDGRHQHRHDAAPHGPRPPSAGGASSRSASRCKCAAADRVHPGDVEEAIACGRRAVELALAGTSGVMVSIVRESSDPYRWSLGTAPLAEVALGAKPMPDVFINDVGNFVTPECIAYLKPLIGPLPDYAGSSCGDCCRLRRLLTRQLNS